MKKNIYAGPKEGFYATSSNLVNMVKKQNGDFVHHDPSASKKYDPFQTDRFIFQLRGATLVYQSSSLRRSCFVDAFGAEEAISEVEKIIAKAEKEYGLPAGQQQPHRSYNFSK